MPQPANPAPLRTRTRHQQRPTIRPRTARRRHHNHQRKQRQQQAERRRLRIQKENQIRKIAQAPQVQRSRQNPTRQGAQTQSNKAQNQQSQQHRSRIPKVQVPLRKPRLDRCQMGTAPRRLRGGVRIHTARSPPRNRRPHQRTRTHHQGAEQLPQMAHKRRAHPRLAARTHPARKPPQAGSRAQGHTHRAGQARQRRHRNQQAVASLNQAQQRTGKEHQVQRLRIRNLKHRRHRQERHQRHSPHGQRRRRLLTLETGRLQRRLKQQVNHPRRCETGKQSNRRRHRVVSDARRMANSTGKLRENRVKSPLILLNHTRRIHRQLTRVALYRDLLIPAGIPDANERQIIQMLTPRAAQLLLANHSKHDEAPHAGQTVNQQYRQPRGQGTQTLPHPVQALTGGGVRPGQKLIKRLAPFLAGGGGGGTLRRRIRGGITITFRRNTHGR